MKLNNYDKRRLGLTIPNRRLHYRTLAFFYYVLSVALVFFSVKVGLCLIYKGFYPN